MAENIPRNPLSIRQGANLPHWTKPRATYSVTFRLADSLPTSVLNSWIRERDDIVATAKHLERELSRHELRRLHELHSEKIESYLDAGHGSCALRDPIVANIVADALRHFDGVRYDLEAWCVMPNHVHVVPTTRPEYPLDKILHSWKSFTTHAINRHLGTTGEFWQSESYDHLVRDSEDFSHAVAYVLNNPTDAGLKNWPWVWKKPCGTGVRPIF